MTVVTIGTRIIIGMMMGEAMVVMVGKGAGMMATAGEMIKAHM
ncbi:MAG TPA: hypothetical protein VMV35_04760 [Halothiobacillus sp.]|nr:hypothetical protein [Halothiobacillus sp.]